MKVKKKIIRLINLTIAMAIGYLPIILPTEEIIMIALVTGMLSIVAIIFTILNKVGNILEENLNK